MVTKLSKYQLALRAIIFSLGLFVIVANQILSCQDGTCLSIYKYFTIQTNLMVTMWLALALLWRNQPSRLEKISGWIRGGITLYITITFVVFAIALEYLYDPTGIRLLTSLASHYIVPLTFIIDWVWTERVRYQWKWLLWWLGYPVLYFVYSQIHGALYNNYLYPFLNPISLGLGPFFISFALLLSLFILLGALYIWSNRRYLVNATTLE